MRMLERPPHFVVRVTVQWVKIHAQWTSEQNWILFDSETKLRTIGISAFQFRSMYGMALSYTISYLVF